MDIRRLLLTLRQQFWLFLGLTLAILTAFVLIPRVGKQTTYISRAKILLTPPQRAGLHESQSGADNWLADQDTLSELVTSERLLTRICAACNLRSPWQELRDRIHFEPLATGGYRQVNLFAVSVEDRNSKMAQKLTQAAIDEFMAYVEELSAREFANTRRFLDELVAEAKAKVDESEEKLLDLTSEHADHKDDQSGLQIGNLEEDKRKYRDELAQLEADAASLQSFQSGEYSALPALLHSKGESSLTQLEASVQAARLKLVDLEQLYTSENTQVVEQRNKLRTLEQLYHKRADEVCTSLLANLNQQIRAKRGSMQGVETRISALRNRQLSPTQKRQITKLERQLSMWEENHLSLTRQLYQARVVEQSSRRQGAITILESPSPGVQAKERRARSFGSLIALGLPFSLGMSIAIIVAIELVGASMRLVPKIESALGVPVMAVIPPVDEEISELWELYKREETLPKDTDCLLLEEPTRPA